MRTRVIAAAAVAISAAVFADEEIAMSQQGVLLLKILKFDRSLETRAAGTATIAVLFQENDPEAEAARVEIQAALESARRGVTFPLPVKVVRIPYSASTLDADLTDARPAAVYVVPHGLFSQVPAISKATRRLGILTFSDEDPVIRAGLSVGLVVREGRPTILVNLPASRAEGADLSSDLLRLSEVIR